MSYRYFKVGDVVTCVNDDRWSRNHGLYEGHCYRVVQVGNPNIIVEGGCVDEVWFNSGRFDLADRNIMPDTRSYLEAVTNGR